MVFSHEFLEREDGWPGLAAAYDLTSEVTGIEHGLAYQALNEGTIDITDDGTVTIASANARSLQQAQDLIRGLTLEPEVGVFYRGVVKRVVDFGCFVEILPGTDGLIHISELAEERTRKVTDVIDEGDEVVVKCINVDRDGKIRLSRKQALEAPEDEINNFLG